MNFKKLLKVISAIVAVAGVIAAVYIAIQKLTAHKEPEYFDDNDFFECDNEIEIVEAKAEEAKEEPSTLTKRINEMVELHEKREQVGAKLENYQHKMKSLFDNKAKD